MSLTATVIPARTPWKPLMGEYKYKMSLVKKYITKSVRKVEQPLLNVTIARKDKKEREPKQRSIELDKNMSSQTGSQNTSNDGTTTSSHQHLVTRTLSQFHVHFTLSSKTLSVILLLSFVLDFMLQQVARDALALIPARTIPRGIVTMKRIGIVTVMIGI